VKANMEIVTLAVLTLLVIVCGGAGVYLAELGNPDANTTNLGDAFWWAVVTIATVGYGDYYPVTAVGRVIVAVVMFSGIGIFVLFVGALSQRRFKRAQSKLKSTTEVQPTLLGLESKGAIKNQIDEMERLSEEDFDKLIITMKRVRHSLREDSKDVHKCSRCGSVYRMRPKICSSCGLELT